MRLRSRPSGVFKGRLDVWSPPREYCDYWLLQALHAMALRLVKIPFLLGTALAFHVSVTAPVSSKTSTKPVYGPGVGARQRQAGGTSRLESALRAMVRTLTALKLVYWTGTLAETASIILASCAPGPYYYHLAISDLPLPIHDLLHDATTRLMSSSSAAVARPSMRYSSQGASSPSPAGSSAPRATARSGASSPSSSAPCPRARALITSGPYAVVRHPSYTGFILCVLGVLVVHGSPGSWLRTSGVLGQLWVRAVVVCECAVEVCGGGWDVEGEVWGCVGEVGRGGEVEVGSGGLMWGWVRGSVEGGVGTVGKPPSIGIIICMVHFLWDRSKSARPKVHNASGSFFSVWDLRSILLFSVRVCLLILRRL
ncbi:hypothetical protein F5I97DRAFT_1669120 [Phlebopus sp. FC_14]|nr:hypothetical protein F5I97DRAFT_1669120 [Phlebopus sp. FC_14]